MRKIVFLDIDGVLNHAQWREEHPRRHHRSYLEALRHSVDPDCLERLNAITDTTGADVVLSSSWRNLRPWRETAQCFTAIGMRGRMIGATPLIDEQDHDVFARYRGRLPAPREPYPRGYEIQEWIDANTELAPTIVILDDDDDMEHLRDRHVHTSSDHGGLQLGHVRHAIMLLGR